MRIVEMETMKNFAVFPAVSMFQFEILVFMREEKSMAQVSEFLTLSKRSAPKHVYALRDKGYVEKTNSPKPGIGGFVMHKTSKAGLELIQKLNGAINA
jgi:DNA-binding MarR family transcriptional regulator